MAIPNVCLPEIYFDTSAGLEFLSYGNAALYNVTDEVSNVSIRRRKDLISDQYQNGTCTIRIYDTNGDWNPQNTSSPYYDKLKPAKKFQIWCRYSLGGGFTDVTNVWRGYVESYNYTYPTNQDIGYLDIQCSDALRILNTSNISTVTGAVAGESAYTRFNKILDMISWPASLRDTNDPAFFTSVAADPGTNRTVLSAIQDLAFADQGIFVSGKSGGLGLTSRYSLQISAGDTPNRLYTNGVLGGIANRFPYVNVKYSTFDNQIYNQAQITRRSGTQQTYTDSGSVTNYGLRNYYQADTMNTTDTDAYNVAFNFVDSRETPQLRVETLTVKMSQIKDLYVYAVRDSIGVDIGSKIRVYNENINGTTIDVTQYVVSVAHDITPTDWTITYGTFPRLVGGFILDSATSGILDTNRLGWGI